MLRHLMFGDLNTPKSLAILVPDRNFKELSLIKHYIKPLEDLGIPKNNIIVFNLNHNPQGKAPVTTHIKPHLEQLGKVVKNMRIKTILCADGAYFKTLCKVRKIEPHYGYPRPTIFEDVKGLVCPNFRQLFYNPALSRKITFSLTATANHINGNPGVFPEKILQIVDYPTTLYDIHRELMRLRSIKELTCDIETYNLKLDKASLASIAFGINQHSGVAFSLSKYTTSNEVKNELRKFLKDYKGKLIFHGGTYDTKVLIWELFMDRNPQNTVGMLKGLEVLFRNYEDTKAIAYLALNSTAGNSLSLKDLAFEFTGNYALEDIGNVASVSLSELLKYNMTDAVATWYVYNRYRPIVQNTQWKVYKDLFLPALKVITQMELVGMPMNVGQVLNTEHELDDIRLAHTKAIMTDPIIEAFNWVVRDQEAYKATKKLKTKIKTRDDYLHVVFNPASHKQLGNLLHNHLNLDILNTTDTGAPSTDSKTLKAHIEHLTREPKPQQNAIKLLMHIVGLNEVATILNTFIPAFKNNSILKEGWSFLHGNFNLGGTKSGRLSSSKPNLTNIPSTGTRYAKTIKTCFEAPPHISSQNKYGWISIGADYHSLEDMISALLTKDPNKLKVYTDGYDGHCLRAYSYFSNRMPDISAELHQAKTAAKKVAIINSIEKRYPDLRQLAKGPTFALTYMGTWKTLVKNFGLTKTEAQEIENNYHELYSVADQWVRDRMKEASIKGYVELAFGLRLRTPILPQVILEAYSTLPYEAYKEIKTAANALGQSYGLLNTNSANKFMQRVWNSKFKHVILPTCQIHDSQYYLIENSLRCLQWANNNLIECMTWNKLPQIQHPKVKLGATLEVFYPTWATSVKVPNKANYTELKKALLPFNEKFNEN